MLNRYVSWVLSTLLFTTAGVTAAPFTIPTAFFTMRLEPHEHLSWIRKMTGEFINTIATEEALEALNVLGVPKSSQTLSVVGFVPKTTQNLSIVYLNEKATDLEGIAAAAGKSIREKGITSFSGNLTEEGGLFGYKKNEVVIKIQDTSGEVGVLRKVLVEALPPEVLNNFFPFVPHIALGKLNDTAVEAFVAQLAGINADPEVISEMTARIRSRVEYVVQGLPFRADLPTALQFSSIDLYGFDRLSVKKIEFKNKKG